MIMWTGLMLFFMCLSLANISSELTKIRKEMQNPNRSNASGEGREV